MIYRSVASIVNRMTAKSLFQYAPVIQTEMLYLRFGSEVAVPLPGLNGPITFLPFGILIEGQQRLNVTVK